jgi:hypothetical protein
MTMKNYYNKLCLGSLCAILIFLGMPTSAQAVQIASDGPNHAGVTIDYTPEPLGNQGLLLKLDMTCSKNWGGATQGQGSVYVIHVVNKEVKFEKTVSGSCSVSGGMDGSRKESRSTLPTIFIPGATVGDLNNTVFVKGSITRDTQTNIDVTGQQLERDLKRSLGLK